MKNLVNCIDDIYDEESNHLRKNQNKIQNTKIKKMRNYKNY